MLINNEVLNVISNLNPDGIVFINYDGNIEYINPAFSDLTGFLSDEMTGLNSEDFNARMCGLCDEGTDLDLTRSEDVIFIQLARPVSRMLCCNSRAVIDNSNNSARILYFHDMTCEQERDVQINSEFLSQAAHKLRTPLVGILGFSELMMKRDFDTDKQKEMITSIFRQATYYKQVFDDYLDICRLDIKKGKDFNIEKVTFEKVLDASLADINLKFGAVEINYEPPEHWPLINFDYDKMRQVLNNLLSNAVKYSTKEGGVTCNTIIARNNGVEEFGIRFIDQGIGISPVNLKRIGERFYRIAEDQSVAGSGLGISIVKSIIAIHKGRFEIMSKKGEGTTAIVWLPVDRH